MTKAKTPTSRLGDLELALKKAQAALEDVAAILAAIPAASRSGRKPLEVPLENITAALRDSVSIADAARSLGVSRGYIRSRVPGAAALLKKGGF